MFSKHIKLTSGFYEPAIIKIRRGELDNQQRSYKDTEPEETYKYVGL
jgi:hypothetical protein